MGEKPLALKQILTALESASSSTFEIAVKIARRLVEFRMTSTRGAEKVDVNFKENEVVGVGKPITVEPLSVVERKTIEDILRYYGFNEVGEDMWKLQLRKRDLMRSRIEAWVVANLGFDGDKLRVLTLRPMVKRVGAHGLANLVKPREESNNAHP